MGADAVTPPAKGRELPYQTAVRTIYAWPNTQMFVALLISANFVVNVLEKELDPSSMFGDQVGLPTGPTRYTARWQALEDSFNIIFLIAMSY